MPKIQQIHPTAIIHPGAKVEGNVDVGPYAIIGDGVRVGEGTHVKSHSVLEGPEVQVGKNCEIGPHATMGSYTKIGDNNKLLQFSCIGSPPQDLKFKGENSGVEIGDGNTFRECVTVHRGTENGGGITRVGNHNLLMAYSHIAHDCIIGSHVVMANSVGLAGHVEIQDCVTLGAFVGVGQFCRVGTFSFIGASAMIIKDVLPYVLVSASGFDFEVKGINTIGLRRRGVSADVIRVLKKAFKVLYMSDTTLSEGTATLKKEMSDTPEVKMLVEFIENSKQGIIGRRNEKYAKKAKSGRDWSRLSRELSH